jgi:hypothetical protein
VGTKHIATNTAWSWAEAHSPCPLTAYTGNSIRQKKTPRSEVSYVEFKTKT